MTPSATFDNMNITSKEDMRKAIRHALTEKSPIKFPNIDIHAELWDKPKNFTAAFCDNFRNAGGKFIICENSNFVDRLHKLIDGQRYASILNLSHSLSPVLTKRNLNFITSVDAHQQVDVAIVYSDVLIARTGSMVFTQRHSLYPSVRNLSKNIIVVAFEKNIVLDLKDAFIFQQERNQGSLSDIMEVVTPAKFENENTEDAHSQLHPRFILLLIQ